jgi:biopolymer transport protein ExbD
MAEIESKNGKGTPRVDLTPMVDLNLLLITFFMFTTTLNKPNAMEINMPFKKENMESQSKVKEDAAMTILLSGDHKLYYYEGIENPNVKETTFKSEDGIRDVLIQKVKRVKALKANGTLDAGDELTVLIKPDAESLTNDVIDLIDEMTINDIKIYSITDITPQEIGYIQDYKKGTPGQ